MALQNLQFDMIMNCLFINVFDVIVHFHDGGLVTTSVAIVWGRENSHNRSIVLPLVTLHHELVSSGNEVEVVNVGELFRDVLSEGVARTPW